MLVTIATYLNGLLAAVSVLVLVIVSLPVYLYRYILQHVIVPLWFSDKVGQPVSPTSTFYATEFLTNSPSRCCIVTNFVIEGQIPFVEVEQEIKTKWLSDNKTYPEFKQYIQSWMGFMFWHKDKNFNLENHLYKHRIPDDVASTSSEEWVCAKMEELLNKPFPPKKSPWEIHMIENYIDRKLSDQELTVFLMRSHHSLADGFSLFYAVIECLFGTSLAKVENGTHSKSSAPTKVSPKSQDIIKHLYLASLEMVKYGKRMLYDLGWFNNLQLRPKTPWHIPDNKKSWKQLYARSELIPIERLKAIKNRLGVSFTGVILSCISAGVSKSMHGGCRGSRQVDVVPTTTMFPLPGHPKKLVNHAAPAVFDLPIHPSMDSVTRLKQCEESLQLTKQSTMPFIAVLTLKLLGLHLAPVARFLLDNRVIPMGLSNFPGPEKEIEWNGRRGLGNDFITGGMNGVAGVGFMVLSYRNKIRIAATAENAVMERDELEQLISYICQEIECLEKTN